MAEKRIVCFQSKNVKICSFFYISNNYYIYLKSYFEIQFQLLFLVVKLKPIYVLCDVGVISRTHSRLCFLEDAVKRETIGLFPIT